MDERARRPEHGLGEIERGDARAETRERERGVAGTGRDIEHAPRAEGAPPREQALEIFTAGMPGARDVRGGDGAELRLDLAGVRVAHFFFARSFARSARWRNRKSASSGERSKRREASSTSCTRSMS